MSVLREALVLPGMFLTVTLLGGLRVGADIRFLPPPLISLVLGVLLVVALVRAGAVDPAELANHARKPLENLSGAVVALTLAAASVQVFNLLIPDRGLLHLMFGTFFFVQLLSTIAGTSDRRAVLRSLAVLLGSAFVLRYIVLESLYARNSGVLTRVITALMEGVSLGAVQYEPTGPSTGYLAFLALVLYLTAVFLLRTGRGSGVLLPSRGNPAQSHELDRDLPPLGRERQSFEGRLTLEARGEPLRLPQNLGVQIFDLSADRFHAASRALDVLGLLHAPADATCGGRRATDIPDANCLAPQKSPRKRCEHRDPRLQLGFRGLLLLPFDGRFRAAQPFGKLCLLCGVLAAHGFDRFISSRTVHIEQADPEVPLALAGV
jgi:hypothetical protein